MKDKLAMLIVGKNKKEKSEDSDSGYGEDEKTSMAEDILDALNEDDAEALAHTLSDFVKSCVRAERMKADEEDEEE